MDSRAAQRPEQMLLGQPLQFRIGIVDDHDDTRSLLRVFFGEEYLITDFATGEEFLSCNEQCDLVLSDISMPGMDGFQLLSQMRSNKRLCKIPVIAMTAHAGPAMRKQALAAGFLECFAKPFDLYVLSETIKHCLAARPAGRRQATTCAKN